jgi:hypothetical protein
LTVGPTVSPRATAFLASKPAPTITVGLEVFVHDVMAAIATEPAAGKARAETRSGAERIEVGHRFS